GVVLIRSECNLGFAGGNNLGIKVAKGEYVMLLNNDIEIKEDIFTPIVKFFLENKKIGAVSPKIVYDKEPFAIQYGGYDACDRYMFAIKSTYHGMSEADVKDVAKQTPFVHGASVMFSREAIERVGLMREDYFLYFEELDYSLRITECGYQIWYYPFVKVFHDASHTTSRNSYAKIYYNSRNRFYLASNNLKGVDRVVAIASQMIFSLPKNIVKAMLGGNYNHAKAHLHGAYDFIRHRRGILS
ncbi:MAG: glycosyltransferase family 2 protein, partial [Rikenellaceae bacterium]